MEKDQPSAKFLLQNMQNKVSLKQKSLLLDSAFIAFTYNTQKFSLFSESVWKSGFIQELQDSAWSQPVFFMACCAHLYTISALTTWPKAELTRELKCMKRATDCYWLQFAKIQALLQKRRNALTAMVSYWTDYVIFLTYLHVCPCPVNKH